MPLKYKLSILKKYKFYYNIGIIDKLIYYVIRA